MHACINRVAPLVSRTTVTETNILITPGSSMYSLSSTVLSLTRSCLFVINIFSFILHPTFFPHISSSRFNACKDGRILTFYVVILSLPTLSEIFKHSNRSTHWSRNWMNLSSIVFFILNDEWVSGIHSDDSFPRSNPSLATSVIFLSTSGWCKKQQLLF